MHIMRRLRPAPQRNSLTRSIYCHLLQDHEGHIIFVDESNEQQLASKLFRILVDLTNQTVFEFHTDVDVDVHTAGNYLPMVSLQFFLSNTTIHGHAVGIDAQAALKFDVANLVHQRSVRYYELPIIQTVSSAILIVSYLLMALAGGCQAFFLGATFYYRTHSVFKLSQGSFLMVLQGAGIFATACSFLYNPKSDAFCVLQSPMTLIPIQFMLAIVFGRLRRIIRIMEPLMDWHGPRDRSALKSGISAWRRVLMNNRDSSSRSSGSKASSNSSNADDNVESTDRQAKADEPKRNGRISRMFSRSNIRQQFTARRLCLVIILVTLPIIIVEIIGLSVFQQDLTLEMNAEESTGRYECGSSQDQIYHLASTAVIFITLFATLCEAQRSRRLPGLFNEGATVSIALISSLFVASLGFAVIVVSNEPSTSPDAPYIMEVIIVAFVATSLVGRLTYPKLQLIWKGEKIVISKILDEHRKSKQSSTQEQRSQLHGTSGVSSSSLHGANLASLERLESEASGRMTPFARTQSETDRSVTFDEAAVKKSEEPKASRTKHGIVIRSGQAPPSKLTYQVVNHSNVMARVNERILSGLQVDNKEWENVQASLQELNALLENADYRSTGSDEEPLPSPDPIATGSSYAAGVRLQNPFQRRFDPETAVVTKALPPRANDTTEPSVGASNAIDSLL